jgi:FkbM family methyltransferase
MKYSQYTEEDFLLDFFKNKSNGFLVDIGAADGITNSNSRRLILDGWSGILIEPNKKNYNKLLDLYPNKNTILNCGCSYKDEGFLDFYIDNNDEYEQLSTFNLEQSEFCKNYFNCEFTTEQVEVFKTSVIFEKHNVKKINFLSIDTESFDYNVILGIDFNTVDIDLICVEHVNQDLINHLESLRYSICHKTLGNVFFKKI